MSPEELHGLQYWACHWDGPLDVAAVVAWQSMPQTTRDRWIRRAARLRAAWWLEGEAGAAPVQVINASGKVIGHVVAKIAE